MTADSSILKDLPLVQMLSDEDRQRVMSCGHQHSLAKGEILFHEGDVAESLCALVSGRLKLVRYSPRGKELLLHLVPPGASFAEAALFGSGCYPATAEAVEPSVVWCLPRAQLVRILREYPEIGMAMIASVSAWTRTLAGKLEMLTQRRVEERLALFLMSRAGRRDVEPGTVIELGQPKHLVAAECGTGPEVLSRTFKSLEEDEIIETGTTSVKILDPERLAELAEWIGA
jgi:CRP/FNR family transcriptional regulator